MQNLDLGLKKQLMFLNRPVGHQQYDDLLMFLGDAEF
jgi:hypothetical protein